jgi:hypothetical protein
MPSTSEIRKAAYVLYGNRIMGVEFYPENSDPELEAFINARQIPEGTGLNEHGRCWTQMRMALEREYIPRREK